MSSFLQDKKIRFFAFCFLVFMLVLIIYYIFYGSKRNYYEGLASLSQRLQSSKSTTKPVEPKKMATTAPKKVATTAPKKLTTAPKKVATTAPKKVATTAPKKK